MSDLLAVAVQGVQTELFYSIPTVTAADGYYTLIM